MVKIEDCWVKLTTAIHTNATLVFNGLEFACTGPLPHINSIISLVHRVSAVLLLVSAPGLLELLQRFGAVFSLMCQ